MESMRRHPVRTAIIGLLAALAGLEIAMIMLWRQRDRRVLNTSRLLNRTALNHVTLRFAGKPHTLFATIEHTGRQTGRTYQTPVIAVPAPGAFVVSLPYGESDWYRNALKANSVIVYWQGGTYITGGPERAETRDALAFFSLPTRLLFRALNIDRFVRLPISSHQPVPVTAPEAEVHA
jgi:deazaflavin-dependent oxidoreductase (nitroreductase family)